MCKWGSATAIAKSSTMASPPKIAFLPATNIKSHVTIAATLLRPLTILFSSSMLGGKISPMSAEKTLCETPTPGKQPTRIDLWKYQAVERCILEALRAAPDGLKFSALTDEIDNRLSDEEKSKLGSLMWYTTTVKLHMETTGAIRRVPGTKPQVLTLGEAS